MPRRQPPLERSDSTEANAETPLTQAEAVEAMEKFKDLTRKLLSVPRSKVEKEHKRFRARRARLRKN